MLKTFPVRQWNEHFPDSAQELAINSLENGAVLYFPELAFSLLPDELPFLNPDCADPKSKNIGFDTTKNRVWGVRNLNDNQHFAIKSMLERFSHCAYNLIHGLLPHYANKMTIARTSYRPVQISDRKTSYRKDDKRLHVDAFPSAPNQGKRILRVFCNINPNGEDRVWRVGEPFEHVAKRFIPQIGKPFPGKAFLLRMLKITKSIRTPYDHYMLQLHDRMKADDSYQQTVEQQEVRFPPGSTWIVMTDQVSHAAMEGQYVLEQTFYLPIKSMKDESRSPLRVLEQILGSTLV